MAAAGGGGNCGLGDARGYAPGGHGWAAPYGGWHESGTPDAKDDAAAGGAGFVPAS